MAHAPTAGVALQNLIQNQPNLSLLQQLVNAPFMNPPPAAPAPPVENAMVTALKNEVIPHHLHAQKNKKKNCKRRAGAWTFFDIL